MRPRHRDLRQRHSPLNYINKRLASVEACVNAIKQEEIELRIRNSKLGKGESKGYNIKQSK